MNKNQYTQKDEHKLPYTAYQGNLTDISRLSQQNVTAIDTIKPIISSDNLFVDIWVEYKYQNEFGLDKDTENKLFHIKATEGCTFLGASGKTNGTNFTIVTVTTPLPTTFPTTLPTPPKPKLQLPIQPSQHSFR